MVSSPRKRGPITTGFDIWVPAYGVPATAKARLRASVTRYASRGAPRGDDGGNMASRHRRVPCDGGERNRAAVESQRKTEGRAAAAQEGGKRRGDHVVAALVEFRAQAPPAA